MDRRSIAVAGEPSRVTPNGRRYHSKGHKEAVIAKCLVQAAPYKVPDYTRSSRQLNALRSVLQALLADFASGFVPSTWFGE